MPEDEQQQGPLQEQPANDSAETEADESDEDEGYEDASQFGDYDDVDDMLDAFQELAEEIDSHGKRMANALKAGTLNDPTALAAEVVETVMNFLCDLSQITFDACVEALERDSGGDDGADDAGAVALAMMRNLAAHFVAKHQHGTAEEKQMAEEVLKVMGIQPPATASESDEPTPSSQPADGSAATDPAPAPPADAEPPAEEEATETT